MVLSELVGASGETPTEDIGDATEARAGEHGNRPETFCPVGASISSDGGWNVIDAKAEAGGGVSVLTTEAAWTTSFAV